MLLRPGRAHSGIYADRVVGGHRDYCDSGCHAVARVEQRKGAGKNHQLQKQRPSGRTRLPALCRRQFGSLAPLNKGYWPGVSPDAWWFNILDESKYLPPTSNSNHIWRCPAVTAADILPSVT